MGTGMGMGGALSCAGGWGGPLGGLSSHQVLGGSGVGASPRGQLQRGDQTHVAVAQVGPRPAPSLGRKRGVDGGPGPGLWAWLRHVPVRASVSLWIQTWGPCYGHRVGWGLHTTCGAAPPGAAEPCCGVGEGAAPFPRGSVGQVAAGTRGARGCRPRRQMTFLSRAPGPLRRSCPLLYKARRARRAPTRSGPE